MTNSLDIEQLSIDRSIDNPTRLSGTSKLLISASLLGLLYLGTTFFIHAGDNQKNDVINVGAGVSDSSQPIAENKSSITAESETALTVENPSSNNTAINQGASILDASGHIVARRIATVSSRVTGKLVQLNIEEGQRVSQSEVLAELDNKQAQISYQLVLAELAAKQASYNELIIVQQYEQKRLNRRLTLFANALVSEQVVDDTRFTLNKIVAQLKNRQALIALTKQKVALAQYQLAQHKIRAPFDGVVISKNAQVGELISTGASSGGSIRTGVGTIVDMSSLEIEVEVGESYIKRVFQGQKTIATLDAYPDWKIASEVVAVIPTADRQKASIKVRIKLLSSDNKILPDMGVKVSFYSKPS